MAAVNVQVLGLDTGDSSPCVLVNGMRKSYMFNCGEGTQRLCNEYKVWRQLRIGNLGGGGCLVYRRA